MATVHPGNVRISSVWERASLIPDNQGPFLPPRFVPRKSYTCRGGPSRWTRSDVLLQGINNQGRLVERDGTRLRFCLMVGGFKGGIIQYGTCVHVNGGCMNDSGVVVVSISTAANLRE